MLSIAKHLIRLTNRAYKILHFVQDDKKIIFPPDTNELLNQ